MKKIACQYAIVRFSPYVETEEFANVGIVMMAAKQRYFDFQLALIRYGRITRFFHELDANVYKSALYALRDELNRTADVLKSYGFDKRLKSNDTDFAQNIFQEIIRPRETIIKFSNARTILAEDPGLTLKELFSFYVERSFVTKQYREAVLERGIRQWLFQAKLGDRFVKAAVGNDEYHVNFPFVEKVDERVEKVIKPLFLGQEDSSKIINHGGVWLTKINQLKKRQLLPQRVLFSVEGPENNGKQMDACMDIVGDLRDTGVEVLPFGEKDKVLEFALN